MLRRTSLLLACLLLLPGCVRMLNQEQPTSDGAVADTTTPDQRIPDGPTGDLSLADAALVDTALPDQSADVASSDLPAPDLSLPDTLHPDAPVPLDSDKDGIPDTKDNCPQTSNVAQKDLDKDSVGDACDNCVEVKNGGQADTDGDTVGNACDNCLKIKNSNQANMDKDAWGDLCDDDMDGDQIPNVHDPAPEFKDTVYYYKEAGAIGADFETLGTWAAGTSGKELCQQVADGSTYITRLKSTLVPFKDYVAETRFSISAVNSAVGGFSYAGITWRSTGITGTFKDMYACAVDFKDWRLVMIKYYSGSGGGEVVYASSPSKSVSSAKSYRVRIKTVGSGHKCELVGTSTPSLALTNTYHSGGTVGFVTYGVKACFDYLTVVAP